MSRVVGQQPLKENLKRLLSQNKLPHALLFYGPDGVGKEAAALEIGKFLLCQSDNAPCGACASCRRYDRFEHPDFYFLFPLKKPAKDYSGGEWENAMNEKEMDDYRKEVDAKSKDYYYKMNYPSAQNILIGQVRQIIQKSSLKAFSGDNRFAIISPAHLMNNEAQNSLLKLLEEPPEGFYLCLATSRPEALLPTVVSRCQPFYFPPLSKDVIKKELIEKHQASPEQAEAISGRADGSFAKTLDILRNGEPLRNEAVFGFISEIVTNDPLRIFMMLKGYNKEKFKEKNPDKREIISIEKHMNDKNAAVEILLNVDHWLRDIDMMDSGLKPQYNPDLMDRLQKFRGGLNYKDISKMRTLLMNAVDLINKNVYIDLIYLNLANQFSKLIRKKAK